jgi:transcriptional regulator with XRE-family HTH domain
MVTRIEIGGTGTSFLTIQKLADALDVDPAAFFSAELQTGKKPRPVLSDLIARLSGLSDTDLAWMARLMDAALKPR